MDLDAHFREATERICRHLDVEQSLHSCLHHLAVHMPGRKLFLDHYDHEQGTIHALAEATIEGGKRLNRVVPLPSSLRSQIEAFWGKGPEDGGAFVVNNVRQDPICALMCKALGEQLDTSLLGVFPSDGERVLGAVVLLADGANRFSPEHAQLFTQLRLPFAIALSNTMKHREVLELKERLADDNRFLQRELMRLSGEELVGEEFGLRRAVQLVRQVSAHSSPVLLLGETGVGKDLFANHIHALSPRRDGPLIKVNCGAIPDNLIDSELFGHEKGAFTGALAQRRGRFERASGGTVFLDEVGELPSQAQVRLLRVLQQKEIERVGGDATIKLDIRIIAATNRNLEEMVRDSSFREDLWFRLAVFPIFIPPLRERPGDIPALVQHFIRKKSIELKLRHTPKPTPEVLHRLTSYEWPGNVRELQNVIERALILSDGAELLGLDSVVFGSRGIDPSLETSATRAPLPLDEVVRWHIQRVLAITNGRVQGPDGAAEVLGLNPSTLRHRMKRLGVSYGRAKSSA